MARIWDEVDGVWLECEPVWSGRGSLPGMSGKGWEQKENTLLRQAPGPTGFLSTEDVAHVRTGDKAAWGRTVFTSHGGFPAGYNPAFFCDCGKRKRNGEPKCATCLRPKAEALGKRLRRCSACAKRLPMRTARYRNRKHYCPGCLPERKAA